MTPANQVSESILNCFKFKENLASVQQIELEHRKGFKWPSRSETFRVRVRVRVIVEKERERETR